MRLIKFFVKSLLSLILLFLIFWIFILGSLQTEIGQKWALNQFIRYLEQTTQAQFQIKSIYFSFPLTLKLEEIKISKDYQPLLNVQNVEIRCAYFQLLQGKIVLSKLHATDVDLFQLSSLQDNRLNASSLRWDTSLLPFYIKFENIDIQRIRVSSSLIQSFNLSSEIKQMMLHTLLNLKGMVSHNPYKSSLNAHLLLTAKNDQTDLNLLSLGLDTQNHQLSLALHLNQLPLHLLQLDLPSNLKAHLALYASAPLADWQSLSQNSLLANEQIEGHFKMTLHMPSADSSLVSALIGQKTIIRSRFLMKSTAEIELANFKIDNPNFFLQGGAIVNTYQEIQDSYFSGEVLHLDRFQEWIGKEIQGQVLFEGETKGSLQDPTVVLHLDAPHLLIDKQVLQHVHFSLQTQAQIKNLKGLFDLTFRHQDIPWKIASAFDWNNQKRLTLSHLQINAMQSNLKGEIAYSFPDFVWEGFLETQAVNLNDISHFLTHPISGEGQFKIHLVALTDSSHHKKQGFDAEFIGKGLKWREGYAQQLILNFQANALKEKSDFFQIQTILKGQEMKWKDFVIEKVAASSLSTIDIHHQTISHLAIEWQAQRLQSPMGNIAEGKGNAELDQPLQAVEGMIQFTFQDIQTPDLYLQQLTGSTHLLSRESLWPLHLNGKGILKENFTFALEANWHYGPHDFQLQAQSLMGQFGPYPFQTKRPFAFLQSSHKMQLAGLWLQWGEAEIQTEFNRNHANFSTHFRTNAIPSELFHFIAPHLALTGRATFQGHLEGDVQKPKGEMQVDLHHVQIKEDIFKQQPFITGKVFLNLGEQGVQLKSQLNGIGHTPVMISGQLPLIFSLDPFKFKIDSHLPFQLALNAEGELDPYLHLFYRDVTNLSGHTKISLQISGQTQAPQVRGTIDLVNGTYESLSTGALYHNIQAHLEGEGSDIVLKQFSAQDNKNGSITATGFIKLDASKSFPFEFQIHPSRVFILDSDYAAISASGPLKLSGNTKKSKLQGELLIDQSTVHLEEALPQQIKHIDITYINLKKEDQHLANYSEKKETNSTIDLDVKLGTSQNILIEGNRLKSSWKGNIAINGTPANPLLYGDLRLVQGQYDFNGKVFNLSQGNIHFAGAPDKKTTLYVVATKEIDRITAEIIVKGPADKPVVSFRSNPPLSQREVLSYILFNRGISDITSDQGDQLSQSFISLNSNEQTESSDDFLSRLRNNIGIDRLDFTTNDNKENRDFGLQLGKHLTEDIMISVNQSVISLSPIIAVEAKLLKNIKLQAEAGVGEDMPMRISIKWKKDY